MFIRFYRHQFVYIIFLLCLGYGRGVMAETLVAHWQMDEVQWSGQNSEVLDTSAFANHGTAINGGSTAEAMVCRGGWFRGEGYNADPNNTYYRARYYVRVPDNASLSPLVSGAKAALSLSGWFNTAISNGTIIHKGDGGNSQEYRVFIEGNALKFTVWNHYGSPETVTLNYSLSRGQWYFFHASAERVGNSDNMRLNIRLYSGASDNPLATNDLQTRISQDNKNTSGRLYIGAVSYGGEPTSYFDGWLDEIRVYQGLRAKAQIIADKNASRVCSGTLQCFTDDFQRDTLGDNWAVTNKSGSFGNPRIEKGRLRITNNSANVATATTLQRLFPSESNLITLEYDFYAYGGNGADGMVVVLSDGNVTPEPGAFGGSLGYAQKGSSSDCRDCPGFAGGWLGLGLDTFGNYSNPTEGRSGGPGPRRNAIALRGSGVGQTGYSYIAGTSTLSPAVRTGNSAVKHRYRITIDSTNLAHSWVTIERDTGGGYSNLIGPVDVLTNAGQAAVPDDLLLTLTGSTGGSNDIHEIDNVQVCAVRMEPVRREIHHFRISHSGTGLTCAAEPVTVEACANDDCSERFSGEVSLTMSPASGWIGGANYTQSGPTFNGNGGQFGLALSSNVSGNRTLAIAGSVPTAQNVTRCFSAGKEGSCQLVFSDIGIQLDGDSADEMKSAIPTQLTGKPSNVGYNRKQQRLRVVKANETTGACETAVRDKTLDVQFSYTVTGAAGLADNSIIITSEGEQQALVSANAARTVPLQFDAQGNGYFTITSQDAGSYSLRAAMDVPIINPEETKLTTTLARSDSTLPFTVRPLALYAAAEGNNGAVAATGPAFRAAGDSFNLSVQAVSWQPGLDENSDGQWDQCSLPDLGSPTISPRLPAWQLTQQQPGLRLPATADGGVAGMLEYDDNLSFSAGSSISNAARVNYSEVGIVQFDSFTGFQGQPLEVCSGYIGRFYPAGISVESREALTQMYTPACGEFSYMGQPFSVGVKFSALNAAGNITQNYSGDFATARFKLVAETTDKRIENRLMFVNVPGEPDEYPLDWLAGISTVTDAKVIFIRGEKPADDLPFMKTDTSDNRIALGAEIVRERDRVKVAAPNLSFNANAELLENTVIDPLSSKADIRFGRMVLDNAYGPENENLPLVARAEYWNGAAFVTNPQDNCSPLNDSRIVSPITFNPQDSGSTTITADSNPLWPNVNQGSSVINGASQLWLNEPDPVLHGTGNVEYQLNDHPWLQYDWDADGGFDENPTAEFMFGRFRGNPRQIYWRELFQ